MPHAQTTDDVSDLSLKTGLVSTNEAERTLEAAILKAHQQELPTAPAIDPISLVALIGALIEMIRGCRTQTAAATHIKRGSALAYRQAYRGLLREGYERPEARKLARNLARQGPTLTDSQIHALVHEAEDSPESDSGPTVGLWPL